MICVVKRDKEEKCTRPYLIIEGAHRTTALQRNIKEYKDKVVHSAYFQNK